MNGPVVVGLDGSPASMTAVRWAAREAVTRRLPLLLLHSWTTQPLDVPTAQDAERQRYGQDLLRQAAAGLRHRHGGPNLTTDLVAAPAAQALLERAQDASLLVVGSRGHGSPAGFLLGSVAMHVLGLARCPVVAVRADGPEGGGTDEIVVGIGRTGPAADPLLEFALVTAAARGLGVRAVAAVPGTAAGTRPADALEPWRDKFPEVPLTEQAVPGSAAQVLPAASAGACLTVVGRGHRSSRPVWKLGPVAHAVLHHAPGPVAVVPHE
ncbi:universal stress protein [Streptomyces sp. NPDC003635]